MIFEVVRDEHYDTVKADFFSIEDGGTLVFWEERPGNTNLAVKAYAAGTWFLVGGKK
jgi:hypothetical protein